MKKYKAIFFDLDHTLWDYELNSRETLTELFQRHALNSLLGCNTDQFLRSFDTINRDLWQKYDSQLIGRDEIRSDRFNNLFNFFGINSTELALEISDEYIRTCPTKKNLLPHAQDVLNYLYNDYPLHVLTNGFGEVQELKLQHAGIRSFFQSVITSETTGHRKPSSKIFEYACESARASPAECLMIGDNLNADIGGAMRANMATMYFNPLKVRHESMPHYEIHCLSEIRNLL